MAEIVSEERKAYIISGPTSGAGRATALKMAKHGTLVLVGRNSGKLNDVEKRIERLGGHAVPVVCDMSDLASVRRAAAQIIALDLPIVGMLNNVGVQNPQVMKNVAGWDMTFATNHVGPFALTEAQYYGHHVRPVMLLLGRASYASGSKNEMPSPASLIRTTCLVGFAFHPSRLVERCVPAMKIAEGNWPRTLFQEL
jgi:NAD(P)-dependent dehydrogenase (short-subunit alcohol dehydrogenase family)